VILVAVIPTLPAAVLERIGRTKRDARARLRALRAFLAPDARIAVETDRSVPRGLARVVSRGHPDLLVLGSSRRAAEWRVRIGRCTRQLLGVSWSVVASRLSHLWSCADEWPEVPIGARARWSARSGSTHQRAVAS
jgi:nucleotide-binding universal stress UspA family protein